MNRATFFFFFICDSHHMAIPLMHFSVGGGISVVYKIQSYKKYRKEGNFLALRGRFW